MCQNNNSFAVQYLFNLITAIFKMTKHSILVLAAVLFYLPVRAIVKLPAIFSSNMVLQQQSQVPFWGTATPNKKVKIFTSWNKQTIETTADATGKWKQTIATPAYGGPFNIEISDGKKLKLENVLIGEVWLCSGQSNMEMPLDGWGKINNYQQEIANANYPEIRLLQVNKNTSNVALADLQTANGGWVSCSPQTVAEFSSVGYFFGRSIYNKTRIPIGLINSSWGGTIAEAWTSGNSLKTMPDFAKPVENIENSASPGIDAKSKYEKDLAAWNAEVTKKDKGFENGKPVWNNPNIDISDWKQMEIPCVWEDNALRSFDGLVWLRKTIEIPAEWENKSLTLSLDVIDDNDIAYYNGVEIGRTEGWNIERKYTIPKELVKTGKAVIVVRVFDTGGGGGIYGSADKINLSLNNNQSISLKGNWDYKVGTNLNEIPKAPQDWNSPNRPTVLYNAMINPIVPFTIKGAIWYQGESNADRAYQYRELFPLMIKDWRKQWNSNFPFYFVQLANYTKLLNEPAESDWAELREAQLQTLHLENTGMAVTIDIGDATDIHPKNKQEVGKRLALMALDNLYNQKTISSGPVYESYRIEGNQIRIQFKNSENGLKTADNAKLKGFSIAGLDHKFHWADARIDGNEIIVTCSDVQNPIAVRYAWATNPDCNLINNAGLPASPFRTDDWQGVTYNAR